MKWSLICSKIGIPADVSFSRTYPRNAWVIDVSLLEQMEMLTNKDDMMNTAFRILEDRDDYYFDSSDEDFW